MNARSPGGGTNRPHHARRTAMCFAVGAALVVALAASFPASAVARAAAHGCAALAVACGVCAVLGIVYTSLTTLLVGRFFSRSAPVPATFPSVTLVKPLHGDEWNLEHNLASFFEQDYPGPVQFLFGVHDPGDAALNAVDALQRRYPHAHVTVVADPRLHGLNRKISNLINMLPVAQHDVLCFTDSDVTAAPDFLRNVVGELQQPGVGLVTCLYRGLCQPGFWPRLSAAATNYQFVPGVIAGLAIGRARPCFGQTIAMTRDMLERIGGLSRFASHLAEDNAIGEAIRSTGATVAIPPFLVRHACVETTFARLFSHELRWSRTIRAVDRLGHLGSALIYPLAFALLAALLSGGADWSWPLVAFALVARALLKWQVDRVAGERPRGLWVLPISDIVSFAIFVTSFLSARVVWRGVDFGVDGKGQLYPLRND
ncbi:ceramide glucosyltransferase [Paraburkholderia caballeronis]|uniref:Ceramide glucosyltransferase n=2 Tax=Paraburkholderia caballeronis TaxID=416943 RepID=A0A1H7F3I3_9BURK|nr:bacteriohopanetetrol glucosamine biosynthesis glycosyltransferase HpnI [Paraburkholderia caballeronis]PXW23843.1 ceramide glucosyltransferase [Paraburkholderia caballeronis]PXW99607.1 ceramide glucosyltransferase [Paraburkholderia caballeronis]RAJ96561.1 ceramide glucosyltransferase [Paraburkholderia caballeronis]SEE80514.1 ceramide glucosyltransferase [Paraburkholderia caballeronis]SEK18570.1 ceramide glucosyltransferase [Paraburkholderia caballeronis]